MVELPRFDFFSCSGFIHYPRNARNLTVIPPDWPLLLGLEGTITVTSPRSLEKETSHVGPYHWSARAQASTPKPTHCPSPPHPFTLVGSRFLPS